MITRDAFMARSAKMSFWQSLYVIFCLAPIFFWIVIMLQLPKDALVTWETKFIVLLALGVPFILGGLVPWRHADHPEAKCPHCQARLLKPHMKAVVIATGKCGVCGKAVFENEEKGTSNQQIQPIAGKPGSG